VWVLAVSDLPLCLGAQGPVVQGGGGGIFLLIFFFMMDFCLCGAISNILTIPKFLEHVCLTACVDLPGLPPSGPK
jgi:uncharacterized membrane protein